MTLGHALAINRTVLSRSCLRRQVQGVVAPRACCLWWWVGDDQAGLNNRSNITPWLVQEAAKRWISSQWWHPVCRGRYWSSTCRVRASQAIVVTATHIKGPPSAADRAA